MLKDFVTVLTTAILSSLPVSSTPAVDIPYSTVEQQVAESLHSAQKESFSVECGEGTLTVLSEEKTTILCEASVLNPQEDDNEVSKTRPLVTFDTEVVLNVKDVNSIRISAKVLEPEAKQLHPDEK